MYIHTYTLVIVRHEKDLPLRTHLLSQLPVTHKKRDLHLHVHLLNRQSFLWVRLEEKHLD